MHTVFVDGNELSYFKNFSIK